jgi:hypothetical protein
MDRPVATGEDWLVRRLALIITTLVSAFFAGGASSAPTASGSAHITVHPTGITMTACKNGYYKNVSGKCVHIPSNSPTGATARCRDGIYSYSQHASGTCSGHGGVARWINHP